jgi:5-methylcytosine-specific restriction endonuclease McrA
MSKQSKLEHYDHPRRNLGKGREFSHSAWNKKILEKDKFRCRICKNKTYDMYRNNKPRLEAHHIIPRRFGGKNTIKNGITLCDNCHKYIEYKSNKDNNDFIDIIKQDKKKLTKECKVHIKMRYLNRLKQVILYS